MTQHDQKHTCKSCHHEFTGSFCNLCGEKVLVPADKSFKTIFNNIMLAVTFVDSRFIKTLWMVIKNPGALSRDFSNGKRVNRLTPTALFFVLNLIYFFFPVIQLFNGKDLKNWSFFLKDATIDPATVFTVKDGVISITGQPFGYMRTNEPVLEEKQILHGPCQLCR